MPVLVLDAATVAGGVIQSIREDGWLRETGPNTLFENSAEITTFIEGLGLGPGLGEGPRVGMTGGKRPHHVAAQLRCLGPGQQGIDLRTVTSLRGGEKIVQGIG